METLRLVSLQVGLPLTLGHEGAADAWDRPWTSGIFKTPVTGPLWLAEEGLEGDGQADRRHHGGPEKAVFACASEHLPHWRRVLGREDVGPGAFGENFLLAGATEEDVCIGDILECGTALLQVSQPRQPCWKQGRRWRLRELPLLTQESGRTGWYYRVLRPGRVQQGDVLARIERLHPAWTVARANQVMHGRPVDRSAAAALAALPELAANWRTRLTALALGELHDTQARLLGGG